MTLTNDLGYDKPITVNSSPVNSILVATISRALMALGAILVTKGFVEAGTLDALVASAAPVFAGALMMGVSFAQGWIRAHMNNDKALALAAAAPARVVVK